MNARPQISAEQHFLTEALEPIRSFLDDPAVVEISCQRSNEVWLEKIGQLRMVRHEIEGLDQDVIRHMAARAASFTKQTINAENPLLSATLTGGERVQFVLSPTSATGHAFSIRKQFIRRFDLNDYEEAGAFRFTKVTGDDYLDDVDIELSRLLRIGKARAFLELAAANCGAPPLSTFLAVTVPAVMPGIITGALLMFILALNEFLVSLLLVDARIVTLPVQIYNSIRSIITPDLAAISVVFIAVAAAAIALLDRLVGLDIFLKSK